MAKITIGENIIRVLPNSWKQLKKNNILKLVSLTLTCETAIQTRLEFFLYLTKLSRVVPVIDSRYIELETMKEERFSVSHAQLIDMMAPLNFIFKEENGVVIITSKLQKQIIPFFHVHGIKYFGPDEGLTNISFAEWVETEKHYINYARKKSTKDLDLLIASMYRPPAKDKDTSSKDIRMALNEKVIKTRAVILSHLDPVKKYAILLFYEGCRYFIMQLFENVYSSKSGSEKPSKFGMADVIEALTNDDPTRWDAVEDTDLFKILLSLENRIKRADKLNEKK